MIMRMKMPTSMKEIRLWNHLVRVPLLLLLLLVVGTKRSTFLSSSNGCHAWLTSVSIPHKKHPVWTKAIRRVSSSTTTQYNHHNHHDVVLWKTRPKHPPVSSSSLALFAQKTTTTTPTTTTTVIAIDEADNNSDTPAGIVGAQFFGGNKEKEEFYDPVVEAKATIPSDTMVVLFDRFQEKSAFRDKNAGTIAQQVQWLWNTNPGMRTHSNIPMDTTTIVYQYAKDMQWESFVPKTIGTTPVQELDQLRNFYRNVHVAIIAGSTLNDENNNNNNNNNNINNNDHHQSMSKKNFSQVELRWEIAMTWPTIWEPRILLTGTSCMTIQNTYIVQQVDTLDEPDLWQCLQKQFLPRFWDLYHIGMTPSAELLPQIPWTKTKHWIQQLWFASTYTVSVQPPRWILQPTLIDTGTRDDNNALILPNHAFTCIIKTMGPTKQQYTPVTGVRVQLQRSNNNKNNKDSKNQSSPLELKWSIPLAVEYAAQSKWLLPDLTTTTTSTMEEEEGNDNEEKRNDSTMMTTTAVFDNNSVVESMNNVQSEAKQPSPPPLSFSPWDDQLIMNCTYIYQPHHQLVATIKCSGTPQDQNIAKLRQSLYNQVVKDGYHPITDDNDRPIFFFQQNTVKACYTSEGLGMAVYEWRPQFTKPNEVGILLELQ